VLGAGYSDYRTREPLDTNHSFEVMWRELLATRSASRARVRAFKV
jgi:hypothetical protein